MPEVAEPIAEWETAIRQQAAKLGFDACRFAAAEPPQAAGQFREWLAAGFHGTMHYLERTAAKRLEPNTVLPGARSLIVVAAAYGQPVRAELAAPPPLGAPSPVAGSRASPGLPFLPQGVVARYARHADYHEVVGARLQALAAFVSGLSHPPASTLSYVDTGPVLERDHAARAGLGFIGKHTNLIHRSLGNGFFLGAILTTLKLAPDPGERNHCGRCVRCLAACPTRAIIAPFRLDARRCISYLTIELKGAIPEDLRPAVGARIFGCDDCLAVCPWNRFAVEGQIMSPHRRPDLDGLELLGLLQLDEPGFRQRFAGTPILRAKRRGLLRNVCVALGNIGDHTALPALDHTLRHEPEPLIREHAQWAVTQIQARHAGSASRSPAQDAGRQRGERFRDNG
jgi:epoxyqueuosine reductase